MRKVLIVGLVAAGVFLQGCCCPDGYSIVVPPKLKKEQMAKMQQRHIPLSVAVDTQRNRRYEALMKSLQESCLFDRVDTLVALPNTDLVAFIDTSYDADLCIPFWSLISFWVIPTIYQEDYGMSITFQENPRHTKHAQAVKTQYKYKSVSVLGWICIPLNWLPDRKGVDYDELPELHQQLLYAVSLKKDDIMRLYNGKN